MADEEKNETTEETPEAPAEEAPKDEAPAQEAPAEDAPAEEAPAEDAPAADDSDGEQAETSPDTPAGEAEDVADEGAEDEFEGMDWKARKRLERSRESGEAGPQRSPEDRAKERAGQKATASKVRGSYRRKARGKAEAGDGGTPAAERHPAPRKERQGRVVSDKGDKTITVRIDVARRHPTYEKIVRQSSTLRAHDPSNEAGEGDLVKIIETRPISKTKRWRLIEILEKAK
jgi:small subunit ribosomal protein S17